MALEVGIVGLPGAGKTTLFTALTKTGGAGFGKENVGMASIADDRLEQLAALVGARKITPATIRVVDVPGTGPALLGGLRQVDAILAVADGFWPEPTRGRPGDARAGAACRRPRPRRAPARAGREAGEIGRRVAAQGGRAAAGAARAPRRRPHAARLPGRAAGRARAADDETAARARERPGRDRPAAGGGAGRDVRGRGRRVPGRPFGARRNGAAARGRARPDHVLHRR